MGIATRAMSASVKKGMQVYSALSQHARKAAIQPMGSVHSQGSASVRQAGREKTARNASPSQAVRMGRVHSRMSAIVRRGSRGASVTSQTVAMGAMRPMGIVISQGSASARWDSKASIVMSACLIQAV
jgi:hypothetical protein